MSRVDAAEALIRQMTRDELTDLVTRLRGRWLGDGLAPASVLRAPPPPVRTIAKPLLTDTPFAAPPD